MAISHAILSALIEQPYSGYDLAKQFAGSAGFFWNASQQQIYRELTKLEETGYLTVEVIHQDGRPDKKLYSVTKAGQNHLQQWIAQASEVSPIKDEFLVKLFAGYLVPKAVILRMLEQHQSQHLETLSSYKAIAQQNFQNPHGLTPEKQFRYLTLRNGIYQETAWLAWCKEAIEFLKQND